MQVGVGAATRKQAFLGCEGFVGRGGKAGEAQGGRVQGAEECDDAACLQTMHGGLKEGGGGMRRREVQHGVCTGRGPEPVQHCLWRQR